MQKITSKQIYVFIFLLITTGCAILYFSFSKTPPPEPPAPVVSQKCPEDYADTVAGNAERVTAADQWSDNFHNQNPNASLADMAKARYEFYVKNNCDATLEKFYEMKAEKTDTPEMTIVRETMQEEIQDQQMKNLINALKERKEIK